MIWDYENFTLEEMRCKHTGMDGMQPKFMEMLQRCRALYGRPMIVTSAYRHSTHPIEARKDIPGEHSMGMAADISVSGRDALELIESAIYVGFPRIGLHQKGERGGRFVHLGASYDLPAGVWTY